MVRTMISQTQIANSSEYCDDEGTEETKDLSRNLDGIKERRPDSPDNVAD